MVEGACVRDFRGLGLCSWYSKLVSGGDCVGESGSAVTGREEKEGESKTGIESG
jgi:hypothetical protein